jgi:Fur family ferric uptake transcriptional regulator
MDNLLHKTLKNAGYSLTLPRRAVFEYLVSRGPVSVNDLIDATLPRADRASIYRTLELFRKLEIIQDMVIGGQKVIELSESFSTHHHHLTCTSCGRTIDITDKAIERRLDAIAAHHGFTPTNHQVEVSGLCPNCQ